MDFRLLYSERSLSDLAEIVGRIAEDDAEAARRFGDALLDHLEFLEKFPRLGTPIRKRPEVRKLMHSPIAAYYQIHETRRMIEVLHFRHGARRQPNF